MKLSARSKGIIYFGLSVVIGLFVDYLVRLPIFGLNFTVWTMLWVGLVLLRALKIKKLNITFVITAMLVVVNSFIVAIRAEPVVVFWSVVIVLMGLMYMFVHVFIDGYQKLSLQAKIGNMMGGALESFGSVIGDSALAIAGRSKTNKNSIQKKLSRLSPGVLVSLVLVVVFGLLFSSSDKIFGNSFSWLGDFANNFFKLFDVFNGIDPARLTSIVFWTFVAAVGLSMLLRKADTGSNNTPPSQLMKFSAKDSRMILTSVVAVFGLFVIFQVRYLFIGGNLPAGVSYADYARRGYGELLVATLLASGVIYAAKSYSKHVTSVRYTTGLSYALALLNSVVVLSAWKRLSLYETAYGWTMTRFVARLGLICIFVGIGLLTLWVAKKISDINLKTLSWGAALLVLTVASILNPAGLVAKHNITGVKSRETPLDVDYLKSLSADALPAICRYAPIYIGNGQYPQAYNYLENVDNGITARYNSKTVASDTVTKSLELPQLYYPPLHKSYSSGLSAHFTKTHEYENKYFNCLLKP
jgi:Domain of unknown function (DUF4173)